MTITPRPIDSDHDPRLDTRGTKRMKASLQPQLVPTTEETQVAPSMPSKPAIVASTGTATKSEALVRRRQGASKTIYFADQTQIDTLERICETFPRSSPSSIVQQLVAGLLANLDKTDKENHTLVVSIKLFL